MAQQTRQPRPGRVERGEGLALIWRQLTRARRQFTLGAAGTTAYALATIASSYVIGWVTDDILIPAVEEGELTVAARALAAVAIMGVALIRAFGIAFRRFGAYNAQYRLQARDRVEITDRYLELPIEWHPPSPGRAAPVERQRRRRGLVEHRLTRCRWRSASR